MSCVRSFDKAHMMSFMQIIVPKVFAIFVGLNSRSQQLKNSLLFVYTLETTSFWRNKKALCIWSNIYLFLNIIYAPLLINTIKTYSFYICLNSKNLQRAKFYCVIFIPML